ncbi:MAG: glycoside hydrolase family 43 protein [Gammaproteobacteria bacterium]|nr:glycoside hydrolase family 43 protein [Gammaproteobacteria bacterium]
MILRRPGWLALLATLVSLQQGFAEPIEEQSAATDASFSNPVIPGFAPDPSIVRVDEDFYLINSTFEYFPGIPIYHSRDLVNWRLISYALNDPAQIELERIKSSDGIHASTIRYNDGTFYVITTNNVDGNMVNFIVTAADPRGPWSAPHVLEGAPGIDPSLFFDDDGRVWYVGNHIPPDPEFPGQAEIWLQEVDIDAMALIGERHYLWRGCCGGVWAEGPHLYKKNGYYYLLISEGGTAYEHALSVAISKEITGPYQNNPRNPVLSHRQLSYDYPITGVGHADLVELADGRWYAVALGWRLVDGMHGILGRETFLLPVTWETEPYTWKEEKLTFPVFSPTTGKVDLTYPLPFENAGPRHDGAFSDSFSSETLALEWNFRRAPEAVFHDLEAAPGSLRLGLQAGAISQRGQYSFVGIRQRHFEFDVATKMSFDPAAKEEAGLVAIQNDRSAFLLTMMAGSEANTIRLTKSLHGKSTLLAEAPLNGNAVYLRIAGDYLHYDFQFSTDGNAWTSLAGDVDVTSLSPAVIEGYNYTGVYLGLYATSNGIDTDNYADFDFFNYEPTAKSRDGWFERQLGNETQE